MKIWKVLLIAAAPIAAIALSGCGTVQGFGKDLQTVGRKMENKSEKVESGDSDDAGSSESNRY